jgi:hypothetical protein
VFSNFRDRFLIRKSIYSCILSSSMSLSSPHHLNPLLKLVKSQRNLHNPWVVLKPKPPVFANQIVTMNGHQYQRSLLPKLPHVSPHSRWEAHHPTQSSTSQMTTTNLSRFCPRIPPQKRPPTQSRATYHQPVYRLLGEILYQVAAVSKTAIPRTNQQEHHLRNIHHRQNPVRVSH